MDDLEKAKNLLSGNGYTCVLCRKNESFFTVKRGLYIDKADGGKS